MGIWSEVTAGDAPPEQVTAAFTGTRPELFGQLFGGYLLMLPTLGIYRFWVTTAKRRFYWQNTIIAGEPLEYTGNALQLMIGFLFALAFFLPIYMGFFFFSTQSGTVAMVGYGGVAALLWFLIGYAQYRGRDFRLSRTLWHGIRFDQRGSAMGYALRRFGWSLLVIATLGLAYPLLVGNLWRYRYSNTWFGDRQVSFAGNWKTVAGPFYRAYFSVAAVVAAAFALGWASRDTIGISIIVVLIVAGLALFYWRSREASRMFSQIQLGELQLTVKVRAHTLLGQYFAFSSLFLVAVLVMAIVGGIVLSWLYASQALEVTGGARQIAQSGWVGAVAVLGGYLVGFASFSLLSEVFLDFGYWKAVTTGASVSSAESVASVRAIAEDKALVGEGLADALNVGGF